MQNLTLELTNRRTLTDQIEEFTLMNADRSPLPTFTAGAHLNIETPSGARRSYSLSNSDDETDRYVIAVKKEVGGRGGSASMHDALSVGDTVKTYVPHNAFPLEDAPRYLLIAGGIGITPVLSMLRHLVKKGADVRLIYLTRSPEDTAYADILTEGALAEHTTIHHDGGDPDKIFDFWPLFETPNDTSIYYCGPAPLMQAIYLHTIHWPRSRVHSEDFSGADGLGGSARAFRVKQASTGTVFDIPVDKTILDVLRVNNIAVASSCESGTCGTCRMRVVDGTPQHRDYFLSLDEQRKYVMPCVSRAISEEITLQF